MSIRWVLGYEHQYLIQIRQNLLRWSININSQHDLMRLRRDLNLWTTVRSWTVVNDVPGSFGKFGRFGVHKFILRKIKCIIHFSVPYFNEYKLVHTRGFVVKEYQVVLWSYIQ